MIVNESQYESSVARLNNQQLQRIGLREQLRSAGLSEEKIDQKIAALVADCKKLEEEIDLYERRTAQTWVPI